MFCFGEERLSGNQKFVFSLLKHNRSELVGEFIGGGQGGTEVLRGHRKPLKMTGLEKGKGKVWREAGVLGTCSAQQPAQGVAAWAPGGWHVQAQCLQKAHLHLGVAPQPHLAPTPFVPFPKRL